MTNTTNSVAKITIADKYNAIINYFNECGNPADIEFDVVEFLKDRLEKSKKKSTSQVDEKKAKENAEIKSTILEVLTEGKLRNSDITKRVNDILNAEYQPQKISNVVKQMLTEGTVTREVDKKIAYFSVA